ncbi:MAG: hypothetical protein QME66_09690 [Candidatus Eisenbacteria bacterium]|nr:hypothetical protein [Candidatus Eisenbacteria bacterium]
MKLFVITIDTEADCSADWTGRAPESYANLLEMQRTLVPVLRKAGAAATLLLSPDVIERDEPSHICDVLEQNHGWELGAHLHGEFVEPSRRYAGPAGVKLSEFQCQYPPQLEFAKMQTLKQVFQKRFGRAPCSFRAGRFGAGPETFKICHKLGYKVDTSVVPGTLFREGEATADFREFDSVPRVVAANGGRLIEIPITVRRGRINLDRGSVNQVGGLPRVQSLLGRCTPSRVKPFLLKVTAPVHKSVWLRPSYSSARQMAGLLKWIVQRESSHPAVANMMFHSNELLPGASPYNASNGDVAAFLSRLSATINVAKRLDFEFVTLTQAARAVDSEI